MKMSINKLIANDIINYGMSQTSSFNYIVSLDSYIDDFDEDSQKYILDNLKDICDDISANENIADFEYDKYNKEFNMVFYWDNLLDSTDRYVLKIMKEKGVEDSYELEDIRELSEALMNDDSTRNLIVEKIRNYPVKEYDLWN